MIKRTLRINQIYQGDARKLYLDDNSIDCMITSPPYWGLRDYGLEPMIWDGDSNCEHEWWYEKHKQTVLDYSDSSGIHPNSGKHKGQSTLSSQGQFCTLCNAWRGSLGLEPTFQLYIQHLIQIFNEAKRVLKPTGTCWVNMGDTFARRNKGSGGTKSPKVQIKGKDNFQKFDARNFECGLPNKCLCQIPSRFAIAMTDAGWILRNEIIWHKRNCMPSSAKDRFTIDFEKVFFFTKNKKYWFKQQREPFKSNDITYPAINTKQDIYAVSNKRNRAGGNSSQGRNKRCVWDITTKPFKEAHFAVFPEALIEPMIKAGCPQNGVVLDIFAGSGTVGVVAKKFNRNFIGIELNPEYVVMAKERIIKSCAQNSAK